MCSQRTRTWCQVGLHLKVRRKHVAQSSFLWKRIPDWRLTTHQRPGTQPVLMPWWWPTSGAWGLNCVLLKMKRDLWGLFPRGPRELLNLNSASSFSANSRGWENYYINSLHSHWIMSLGSLFKMCLSSGRWTRSAPVFQRVPRYLEGSPICQLCATAEGLWCPRPHPFFWVHVFVLKTSSSGVYRGTWGSCWVPCSLLHFAIPLILLY